MHKMLKTVKVGNTSLQYTVVSQNDELPVASNTVNVLPASSRKRRTRYRKTVILVLITMVMGCGIVIAAVLVPILIASKLVGSLPESAKFKTFAISASSIQGYGKDHRNQQEHRFVELLPVNQPPIDATIEFQDEFPSASWSIDGKLFFNLPSSSSSSSSTSRRSTQPPPSITQSSVKTFVSNSSDVTIYYNKTVKADTKIPSSATEEEEEEEEETSSDWVTLTIHVVNNISASLIKNAFFLATAITVLVAFVIVAGVTHYCWKYKAHPNKMEWKEDKTVRNKLLTTIPMTDD